MKSLNGEQLESIFESYIKASLGQKQESFEECSVQIITDGFDELQKQLKIIRKIEASKEQLSGGSKLRETNFFGGSKFRKVNFTEGYQMALKRNSLRQFSSNR